MKTGWFALGKKKWWKGPAKGTQRGDVQSQRCCVDTQSGANPVWRIWEIEKEISVTLFNPFVSQSFCCPEKQTGKGQKGEQFQHVPFRKALIVSKLLDSGEGQKQNPQLQSAAVTAAAWREMWGQPCWKWDISRLSWSADKYSECAELSVDLKYSLKPPQLQCGIHEWTLKFGKGKG